MKTFTSLGWLWLVVALLTSPAVAPAAEGRPLQMSGYGKVFFTPDRFDLSFAVVTEDSNLSQCKEKHLAVLAELKGFLDKQGKVLVSLRQDATKLERGQNPYEKRPHRYTTTYTARLKEASTLLPFQEGIVTAGVNELQGLDMFSSRQSELLNEARREAIKDARSKAELAARELDWKLSGATGISFLESYWHNKQAASVNYGSRASMTTPALPGAGADLSTYVDANVSVTYEFHIKGQ